MSRPTPEDIRQARQEKSQLRERDFADEIGISEGELLAAYVGQTTTRIDANPDKVMALAMSLGEVMALTRNASCVNERDGVYENYRSGAHACSIIADEIDLRIFPKHWCHAFLVEKPIENGVRRSVQVFDAAGDAVHKIFLRDGSNLDAFETAKSKYALDDQSDVMSVEPREPVEAPKGDPAKLDQLKALWDGMTDTHQFNRFTRQLKMNRLGAYRLVGEPYVRAVETDSVDKMLHAASDSDVEIMVFVGNKGCIQIHSGPINTLKAMGPWQNVLDPRFNLHLRLDHIAEVYEVFKPSKRGMIRSLEAFDADGWVILQVFARGDGNRAQWHAILDQLPSQQIAAE